MLSFLEFILEGMSPHEIAHGWREHLWHRGPMTKLAKKTVGDGEHKQHHPGPMTVYRGVSSGSASHKRVGTSWTKHKTVAQKYAGPDGKVLSKHIDHTTPALDVNRLLKGRPSKSQSDHEVFIAPH